MNVKLKSGTNEIHGVLFEILQNEKLNANRWENNKAGDGNPRGPFKQNQFGAAVGGPIIKNKLFIFGDYQGTRIASSGGAIQNLGYGGFIRSRRRQWSMEISPALLAAAVGNRRHWPANPPQSDYDPTVQLARVNGQLVRDPFDGQHHSAEPFRSGGNKIMSLYPRQPGTHERQVSRRTTYFVVDRRRQNTDQGDGRVDYRLYATKTACSAA